jgi:hypothetical protein
LKEENFYVLASPEVVSWFRLESLEDFPTLGFPTPPPIKIYFTKEEKISFPLEPIPSSSKTQPILVKTEIPPSCISSSPKLHTVKTPSPPCSPRVYNPMAGVNPPRTRMDAIVVARYAPLVLP